MPNLRQKNLAGPMLALWSLFWRLCLLVPFFLGSLFFLAIEWWWTSLSCIAGFALVAFLMRLSLGTRSQSQVRLGHRWSSCEVSISMQVSDRALSRRRRQRSNQAMQRTAGRAAF